MISFLGEKERQLCPGDTAVRRQERTAWNCI